MYLVENIWVKMTSIRTSVLLKMQPFGLKLVLYHFTNGLISSHNFKMFVKKLGFAHTSSHLPFLIWCLRTNWLEPSNSYDEVVNCLLSSSNSYFGIVCLLSLFGNFSIFKTNVQTASKYILNLRCNSFIILNVGMVCTNLSTFFLQFKTAFSKLYVFQSRRVDSFKGHNLAWASLELAFLFYLF